MKILLDTNVLIAGFTGRGSCHELIIDATGTYDIYYTDYIIDEFQKVLKKKFDFQEKLVQEFINLIKGAFKKGKTATQIPPVCRDADDNQILADALVNNIDVIITGDSDLLEMKNYQGIKIISPTGYWKLI